MYVTSYFLAYHTTQCPYRHSEEAQSSTVVCPQWVERKCLDVACPNRHPGGREKKSESGAGELLHNPVYIPSSPLLLVPCNYYMYMYVSSIIQSYVHVHVCVYIHCTLYCTCTYMYTCTCSYILSSYYPIPMTPPPPLIISLPHSRLLGGRKQINFYLLGLQMLCLALAWSWSSVEGGVAMLHVPPTLPRRRTSLDTSRCHDCSSVDM